jgi:hypothetical protein
MGRMLNALNQGEGKRTPPKETAERRKVEDPEPVRAEAVEPEPADLEDCADDATVPFIEVGGPRHLVHASPDVIPLPRPGQPEVIGIPQPKQPEPLAVEDGDEEPAGTVSIYCSWTLRRGLKQAG